MSIEFKDNSAECKKEFDEALRRALTKCGLVAEGYAKPLCIPDTGLLRNSITYAVSGGTTAISSYVADNPKPGRKNSGHYEGTAPYEKEHEVAVYIGSNVEYAPYVELGTGEYYPGGRPTPWAYQDGNGNWRTTRGNPAKPFLVPAVSEHKDKYEQCFRSEGVK